MLKFERRLPRFLSIDGHQRKLVSTWSPLATTFNSKPYRKLNITRDNVGLFHLPELRTYEGFYLLKENVQMHTDDLIKEAVSHNRSRKMVQIFDELSNTLCRVADLAEFIRIAHPTQNFAYAAEEACVSISGIVERLNTFQPLFQALKNVVNNGDIVPTTTVDQHVGKLFLFDFEQSGIHLDQNERQKVVRLNDAILQLGQKFMSGTGHPAIVPKNDVPAALRNNFQSDGENIYISGLFNQSPIGSARESAYKWFLQPIDSQEELLSGLIIYRYHLATTCGFENYAHRALKSSTVEHPNMVRDFIDELSAELRPRADADFSQMQKIKARESKDPDVPLALWDTPYYTTLVKDKWLLSANEFLPYFSLGGCMEGLDKLMNSLYGVRLQNTEVEPGEVWNSDVYKLSVIHETEGLLGYIYCDFFERTGKPNQDCHFTIQGGKTLPDGSYQTPIVVVMLNLCPARWSGPTLLSPSRVDNLFHEMGHAMHSMLGRTEYQHVTGTRCSTDFAEVPSVLMEYFASDPRVLRTFAKHYRTHEPMSEAMLQRLCASKHIFSASETQLQVFYSALDQAYHAEEPKLGTNTTETLKEVQAKYYSLPYVENTAWQHRFSHLVGYGAKYYSYLISKTIASWIWQTYFEANPFERSSGEKYRREVLAHGGGVPSRQLVANFLQRDVTPKALSQTLINEIDVNNKKILHIGKEASQPPGL